MLQMLDSLQRQNGHHLQSTGNDNATPRLEQFVSKMRQADLPELMIQVFSHYYEQLVQGETGYITAAEAQSVAALPHFEGKDRKIGARWL